MNIFTPKGEIPTILLGTKNDAISGMWTLLCRFYGKYWEKTLWESNTVYGNWLLALFIDIILYSLYSKLVSRYSI